MAHKIRVGAVKKQNTHSTQDTVTFTLGILFSLSGPTIYTIGVFFNFIYGNFSLLLLIIGVLATIIGVILLLVSKYPAKNKLWASFFCFYAAITSLALEGVVEKMKIAAYNINQALTEAGIGNNYPDLEKIAAQMDLINEIAIILFTFLGIFLLILHIFREDKKDTGLPPPEVPPDVHQNGVKDASPEEPVD